MLDSLYRRRRGRALAPLLARATGGLVPDGPRQSGGDDRGGARIVDALRAYAPPDYGDALGAPTRDLLARVAPGAVQAVRERAEPELRQVWDAAGPAARERLALILGAHYGVPEILAPTGLRADVPPASIHAMGRGPLAAGGDFWMADVIAGAVQRSGGVLEAGARVLDFGCSSGRHLRVLAAWRGDVEWLGCDPNAEAVRWASEHLPGIRFFESRVEPPLELSGGSVDAAFAVSVWSHFGAGAAERWLAELARVVRPGGLLVLTTQGFPSLAHYVRSGQVRHDYAIRAAEALIARGRHFVEVFGEDGDMGVRSPEWGMAYVTLDWLCSLALGAWELALHEPARIDANQDLVVLRRRAA